MAFQPPNTGQERQNRKILEQLEEQKKRLRLQTQPGAPQSTASTSVPGSPAIPTMAAQQQVSAGVPPMVLPDTQAMSPAQRAALQKL